MILHVQVLHYIIQDYLLFQILLLLIPIKIAHLLLFNYKIMTFLFSTVDHRQPN